MIYQLRYKDKAAAINDLIKKGVVSSWSYADEEQTEKIVKAYAPETHAVVYIGKIVDKPATINAEGEIETEATYLDGYHIDVMSDKKLTFKSKVTPASPVHKFG